MKKLFFFLPLLLFAEVNPFNVKITPNNINALTPQEVEILKNKEKIKKLQQEVSVLKKQIEDLNIKIVKYDETISNLNEKLQGFNTLLAEINNLQNEIKKLKKENNETKEALKEILKIQEINSRNIETLKDSLKVIISELKQREITPKEAMYQAKKYFYSGKLDKAKELFLYTLSKNYLPATSAFYLGEIAFKNGQYDLALGYYKKSVEYFSGKTSYMPKLLYHTAISFEKLGKNEAAKLTLQKLINDFPDSKYAKLAKKELEKLQ